MLFTASDVALHTPGHVEKVASLLTGRQDHGAFVVPSRRDHSHRDTNGRIIKLSVEPGEFEIKFFPRQVIKSQILTDFV
jgi:hypothetical protein